MNEWLNLPDGGWWQLAGWTMLHFLWLGTLVGLVAAAFRLVLRRASANLRYATALGCLMLLAALPLGIAALLVENFHRSSHLFQQIGVDAATGHPILHRATATPPWSPQLAPGSAGGLTRATDTEQPVPASQANTAANLLQPRRLADLFAVVAAYLPWAWCVGSPLTFLLLTAGVIGGERLRRSSTLLNEGPIAEACAEFVAALGIGRRVTVAICDRLAAPVLVGIVRPMILLPPAALTGWSPDELEMVLLHELAHVRRWDNLVNLAQRFIEAALFFHPAVWLLSNWVRRERESCCDAVVVNRTNRPQAYAELLVALAAQLPRSVLFHPAATTAMAAGPLRGRIRRILGIADDPLLISGKSLGIALGTLLLAATLVVLNLTTRTQAEEETSTATGNAESLAANDAAEPSTRAEQRAATQNNLKDLMLAALNFEAAHKRFPAQATFDASGKPLLSWRVMILPYLGDVEAKLYKEFHLDEPWDSPHNRALVARMPSVFKNPRLDQPGLTNYLAVVGPECLFDGSATGLRLGQVTDGTSHTLAIVEADADRAVEWTKPADWQFDRARPTAGLGELWPDNWFAARADGSVLSVSNRESPDQVGIQFTRAGGEIHRLGESAAPTTAPKYSHFNQAPGEWGTDPWGATRSFADPSIVNPSTANPSSTAPPLAAPTHTNPAPPVPTRTFPTLEEQKLADGLYRKLGLELEPLNEQQRARALALGYADGLHVAMNNGAVAGNRGDWNSIMQGDLLVGLHVWPLHSAADVVAVLERPDLAELNPLKFYVIRRQSMRNSLADEVVTGRLDIPLPTGSPSAALDSHWNAPAGPTAVAQPSEALTVTFPPTNPQPAQPRLLYDGKTFNQWRSAWKTELSMAKRLEAVQALAAFGANGQGQPAAAAILEVAEQQDWTAIDSSSAGRLKQACVDAFTTGQTTGGYRIPAADWFPLVKPLLAQQGKKSNFATYLQVPPGEQALIPELIELSKDPATANWAVGGLKNVDPALADPRVLAIFVQRLKDAQDNPPELAMALRSFLYLPSGPWYAVGQPGTKLRYVPELDQYLFHPDEQVQQSARYVFAWIQPKDAPAVVEKLTQTVDVKQGAEQRSAIRALAALGPQARSAEESLLRVVQGLADEKGGNDDTLSAAVVALQSVFGRELPGQKSSLERIFAVAASNQADGARRYLDPHFRGLLEQERMQLFPAGLNPAAQLRKLQ